MSDATATGAASNEAGGTQQTTTEGTQTTAATGDGTKPGEGAAQPSQDTTKTDDGTKPSADEVSFKAEMPEGVELDQASLDEFTKIVKDSKLSPSERAQKLVDLAVKREADRAEGYRKTVQGWAEEVAADKELGNVENQAAARKVIEDFGTPELKSLLESTGMGNHPELVRFAVKVAKAISEDAVHRSRGDAPAAKDAASVLYNNTPATK